MLAGMSSVLLLTNDDGIAAPGLAALEAAARAVAGARVVIVAPACEQSQCGHRVTTREPLRVEELAADRYAVRGTPADCVRLALFGLGLRPDAVLSGVNHGGNMGQDIVISGTLAAAREAAYHGAPAIAFSHYVIRDLAMDWPRVTAWTAAMLERLLAMETADGEFHNVNFPHLPPGEMEMPEVVAATPARSPLWVEYQSSGAAEGGQLREFRYSASYAARPRDPDSDVAVCFGGRISWSRLRV